MNSAQIMQAFEARRSSSLYRDMLVSLVYRISRCASSYRVQSQRFRLPIAAYRDEIVQALETSQVLVLSGETGWLVSSENSDLRDRFVRQRKIYASPSVHT
jgi:ATP-dependent RNA helicase DHX29